MKTDFSVEIKEIRPVRILQITDMQPVDPGQKRYAERIEVSEPLTEEDLYRRIYRYIGEGVKRTDPDLIIVTGDCVYGEFDDDGSMLRSFIRYMESLNVPWAPVFGNHDNESKKGVSWQCRELENAENCLFSRGNVTGNCNYTIGITRNGELLRVLYMMDSNGCGQAFRYGYKEDYPPYNEGEKVRTEQGFGDDQIDWVKQSAAKIDEEAGRTVPKFFCFHIPMYEIVEACYEKGYVQDKDNRNKEKFTLGREIPAKEGDFGTKGEIFAAFEKPGAWQTFTACGMDGMFFGHCHVNTLSVNYKGVRITYGLKTGDFDYHDAIGSTEITLSPDGKNFTVKHLPTELK